MTGQGWLLVTSSSQLTDLIKMLKFSKVHSLNPTDLIPILKYVICVSSGPSYM